MKVGALIALPRWRGTDFSFPCPTTEGENYSVEHLRRALNIGYKKAKRIFDEMEDKMGKSPGEDKAATKKKRARNSSTTKPSEPRNAPLTAEDAKAGTNKKDDGVKTRARLAKTNLGIWEEGVDKFNEYDKILDKLMAQPNAWPFNKPVDPVELKIPDYFDIIRKPMDLGTVKKKLLAGEYSGAQEMLEDVELVWSNCLRLIPSGGLPPPRPKRSPRARLRRSPRKRKSHQRTHIPSIRHKRRNGRRNTSSSKTLRTDSGTA